jgi:hypothetical protein
MFAENGAVRPPVYLRRRVTDTTGRVPLEVRLAHAVEVVVPEIAVEAAGPGGDPRRAARPVEPLARA